jgi:phosphomannomutase
VIRLGRSDDFTPLDTEALNDAVFAPLPHWIAEHHLDAIVSADGDGDRPLLMDGNGRFVSGDVLGLLTAYFLKADAVATPVTMNSAVERTAFFHKVLRTRVGSPFVIAGMNEARRLGYSRIVGFEPNGGTLLGSRCSIGRMNLAALPTRDAVLPLLAVLALAVSHRQSVADLVAGLPMRHMLSDRIEHVPPAVSTALLARLAEDPAFAEAYFAPVGTLAELSTVDGMRYAFDDGATIHYRGSGNAPELRCYVEADTRRGAEDLLRWGLATAAHHIRVHRG